MRGFIVGTLALAALQVVTQSSSADNISTGLSWLDSGLQRLLSPSVAAIPNRHGSANVVVQAGGTP